MTHITPAFDGTELASAAPAKSRRIMDDYEAWLDEVIPAYVEAADTGQPFTIDEISAAKRLPDPPHPKSQWGSLPTRLQNDGIIRHYGYGGSERAKHSLVHVWIGVPAHMRDLVARRRREDREVARAARAEQRRAA
ncbi:hypothetical protein ACFC0S_17020 [Streptomyces sp. NPDC056084]|uniref:hypothetical protein n=1 Tax=unclassified Streptomyces TaxID=2593676 RepID=UPI0035D6E993